CSSFLMTSCAKASFTSTWRASKNAASRASFKWFGGLPRRAGLALMLCSVTHPPSASQIRLWHACDDLSASSPGDFRNSMWLRCELFYYLLPLICSCVPCPGTAPMRRASRRRAIREASKTGRRAKGTHPDLQPDALGVGTRLAAARLREAGIVLKPL